MKRRASLVSRGYPRPVDKEDLPGPGPRYRARVTDDGDVRWHRLFADLEAEADGLQRMELEADVAERTRAHWAGVLLAERLAAAAGASVVLHLAAGPPVAGVVLEVGTTWTVVAAAGGRGRVVLLAGVEAVEGLDQPAAGAGNGTRSPGVLPLAVVLRSLARDRAPVALRLRSGTELWGTVDRVAADHLDLALHPVGERRPRHAAVRAVALDALLLVAPA